jgi:hypothetical protein
VCARAVRAGVGWCRGVGASMARDAWLPHRSPNDSPTTALTVPPTDQPQAYARLVIMASFLFFVVCAHWVTLKAWDVPYCCAGQRLPSLLVFPHLEILVCAVATLGLSEVGLCGLRLIDPAHQGQRATCLGVMPPPPPSPHAEWRLGRGKALSVATPWPRSACQRWGLYWAICGLLWIILMIPFLHENVQFLVPIILLVPIIFILWYQERLIKNVFS